jgi:hypothetical protein
MSVLNLFRAATREDSPLDGSAVSAAPKAVSDFLTVQSLTNFGAMTGAIFAAWNALQRLTPSAAAIWVPYAFAAGWFAVSLMMSWDGLKKNGELQWGDLAGAIFVGVINSLVLAGAVIGTNAAVT